MAKPLAETGDVRAMAMLGTIYLNGLGVKKDVNAAVKWLTQAAEQNNAGAQFALNAAKERHTQTNSTLQNLLQSVEGAAPEDVATQILALQTSLQATLQTTALLLQTSLLKYL